MWTEPIYLPTGSQAQKQDYKVQMQSRVKVQEGLCILVLCSFSYPSQEAGPDSSPAHGHWFTEGTDTATRESVVSTNPAQPMQAWTQGRFQLLVDPHRNNCTLLIRDAQREDQRQYFFQLQKGEKLKYNFLVDKFWLEVTESPRKHDMGGVHKGQLLRLLWIAAGWSPPIADLGPGEPSALKGKCHTPWNSGAGPAWDEGQRCGVLHLPRRKQAWLPAPWPGPLCAVAGNLQERLIPPCPAWTKPAPGLCHPQPPTSHAELGPGFPDALAYRAWEPRKNHKAILSCPKPTSPPQGPDPEICAEELHYAALNFPRPLETPRPRDPEENYIEIHFHRRSPKL
ncbi:uncharacterized protein LOC122125561 [Dipodomys spectabilis]|uniref:uncharacterized protein LOC122125561 n=1 Tax=Dipodomys spectabilis TaxID=105255 RepID=UPI001C539272|nr:uncharacterized protein LOC122125561 [Dipodomys spectabilis]